MSVCVFNHVCGTYVCSVLSVHAYVYKYMYVGSVYMCLCVFIMCIHMCVYMVCIHMYIHVCVYMFLKM